MRPLYADACKIGILGGIACTAAMGLWDMAHIVNFALIAGKHGDLLGLTSVIYDMGYLRYAPLVLVFPAIGFRAVHNARLDTGKVADACGLSAVSGLIAGILGAAAYVVLWLARPIVETGVVLTVMGQFDLGEYREVLMDNSVISFGDPWTAAIGLVINIVVAGPLILVASVVLSTAAGIATAVLYPGRVK